uniref:Uncharacterized protein n=1 Tax=Ixodes ricinus TaxID=34613 RepID=A0A6B0U449_IXORI
MEKAGRAFQMPGPQPTAACLPWCFGCVRACTRGERDDESSEVRRSRWIPAILTVSGCRCDLAYTHENKNKMSTLARYV